ncbi:hypothetical protein GCM10023205_04770 [Yinghuangia aomiensis]|uniref:AAA domain-containing protein n=1 Tax=Yinghuangia aomiensis TaxID=676205 RepID=A0ABP9GU23_9ACTN
MNPVPDGLVVREQQVLLMINGPLGGGKTTCAHLLQAMRHDVLVYDPEAVGTLVRHQLPGAARDYQDTRAWRALVPAAAAALALDHPGPFVMPMSVLRRTYLEEILQRLDGHGFAVRHVTLHTAPDTLLRRIVSDTWFDADAETAARVRRFRQRRAEDYRAAHQWLSDFGEVLDTTRQPVCDVAAAVEPLLDTPPRTPSLRRWAP